jgi:cytochrome oxidase assembly protein ShyY1
VVRGWLGEADAVPPPPSGAVTVTGWVQPGEGSGVPDPDPTDNVLPELRIASAIQHVDQDLYGGFVIAKTVSASSTTEEDGATTGLEPVTPESLPEVGSSTSLRNLLYAVEWWAFAAFAGFLWWRWVRDELNGEGTGPVAEGPDPAGSAAASAGGSPEPDRQPDREDAGIASTS